MTTRKTIEDYGGPFVDATTRTDAESEMAADEGNLLMEDVAQMTMTSPKAHVKFSTHASANPNDVTHRSHWGDGAGQAPTVTRTGVGLYTIDYADSFSDALGESETVDFWDAEVRARSSNASDDVFAKVLTCSGSTVTIRTESPKGTPADVGNSSSAVFTIGLTLLG